ncbi:TIGR00730 family Rossman fold protein [Pontivivens ytuae]|nr:TIGR00730 family Rossman fold protein [Pontivivens ytuae]
MDICVFCGARDGGRPDYMKAARAMGHAIARSGGRLVYGGGHVGMMGAVADATLELGGEVVGVMPHALIEAEIAHRGLTELVEVDSMHARKEKMAALSDGFVALPGGMGTFEEIFEQITWAQLGIHRKPCGFLNVAGYFDAATTLIDHAVAEGFVNAEYRAMLTFAETPEALLEAFDAYAPPRSKWSAEPVTP